jgi:hypothetical protein
MIFHEKSKGLVDFIAYIFTAKISAKPKNIEKPTYACEIVGHI